MGIAGAYGGGGHIDFESGTNNPNVAVFASQTRVYENDAPARGYLILKTGCTAADLWNAARAAGDATLADNAGDPSNSSWVPARFTHNGPVNGVDHPDPAEPEAMLYLGADERTIFFKRDVVIRSSDLESMCTDIDIVMVDGAMFILDHNKSGADAYFKNWRIKIMDREHPQVDSNGNPLEDDDDDPTGRSIGGQPWLVTQYTGTNVPLAGRHDGNGDRLATLDGCTVTNIGDRTVAPNIGIKAASNLTMSKTSALPSGDTIQDFNILGIRATDELYDINLRNTGIVRGAANNVRVIIHNLTTTSDGGSVISVYKRSSLMINGWDRTKLDSTNANTRTLEVDTPAGATDPYRIWLLGSAYQYLPNDSNSYTAITRAGDAQTRWEAFSGGLHYLQVFKDDGTEFPDFNVAYLEGNTIIDTNPTTAVGLMVAAQDNANPHVGGRFAYISRHQRRHHNTNWQTDTFSDQKLRIRHATILAEEVPLTGDVTVDGATVPKATVSEGRSDGLYIPFVVTRDPDYTGDTAAAPAWDRIGANHATKILTIEVTGNVRITLQDLYNWFKQELATHLTAAVTATRVGSKLDMTGWTIDFEQDDVTKTITLAKTDKFDAIELAGITQETFTIDTEPTVITPTGITVRYTRNAEDSPGMAKITPALPANSGDSASYVNFGAEGSLSCSPDTAYKITMKVDGCYEMRASFDTTNTFSIHYNFTRIPPIDLDALADLSDKTDNDGQLVLDDSDAQDGSGNPRVSASFTNNVLTIYGGSATKGIDLERDVKLTMRLIDWAMRSRAGLDFYDFYLQRSVGTTDNDRLSGAPLHGHAIEYEGDLIHIDDRDVGSKTRVTFEKRSPLGTRVRFGVPVFGRASGADHENRYKADKSAGRGTLIFDNVATIVQNVITGGSGGGTTIDAAERGRIATAVWAHLTTASHSTDSFGELLAKIQFDANGIHSSVHKINGTDVDSIDDFAEAVWNTTLASQTDTTLLGKHLADLTSGGGTGGGSGATPTQLWAHPVNSLTKNDGTIGGLLYNNVDTRLSAIDSIIDTVEANLGLVLRHLSNDVALGNPTIHKRVKDSLAILDKIRFVGTADSTGTQRIEARAQLYGDQLSDLSLTTQISGLTAEQSRQIDALYDATITGDTVFHNPDIAWTFDVNGITATNDNELLVVSGTALRTLSHDGFYEQYTTAVGRTLEGISRIDNTIYGVEGSHDVYSFPESDPGTTTLVYDDPDTMGNEVYGLTHIDTDLYWLKNNHSSVFLADLYTRTPPVTPVAMYSEGESASATYYIIDATGMIYRFTRSGWDATFSHSTGITDAIGLGVATRTLTTRTGPYRRESFTYTDNGGSTQTITSPNYAGSTTTYQIYYVMRDTGAVVAYLVNALTSVNFVRINSLGFNALATSQQPDNRHGAICFHDGTTKVTSMYIDQSASTNAKLTQSHYAQYDHTASAGSRLVTSFRILNPQSRSHSIESIAISQWNFNADGYLMLLERNGSAYSMEFLTVDFDGSFTGNTSADFQNAGGNLNSSNGTPLAISDLASDPNKWAGVLTTTSLYTFRGNGSTRDIIARPEPTTNMGNVKIAHGGSHIYAVSRTNIYKISDSTGGLVSSTTLNTDVIGATADWDIEIYNNTLYLVNGTTTIRTMQLSALDNALTAGTALALSSFTALTVGSITSGTGFSTVSVSTHNSQNLLLLGRGTTLLIFDLDNSNARVNNDVTLPANVLATGVQDNDLYLLMTDQTIQQWQFNESATDGNALFTRVALQSFPNISTHASIYGIAGAGDNAYIAFIPPEHTITLVSKFDLANAQPTFEMFKFDTTSAASTTQGSENPVKYNVALPHVQAAATIATDGTNLYASINGTVYKLSLTGIRIGSQLGVLSTDAITDSRIIVWRDAIWQYDADNDVITVLQNLNQRRGNTNRFQEIIAKTDNLTFSDSNELHTDVYAVAGDGVTGLEDFKGFRSDDSTALEAIQNDAKLTRQILANKYTFTADTPAAGQTTLKIFADDGTTVLKEIVIETSGDRTAATDPDA